MRIMKEKQRIVKKYILGIYKNFEIFFLKETPPKYFFKKHFKCFSNNVFDSNSDMRF